MATPELRREASFRFRSRTDPEGQEPDRGHVGVHAAVTFRRVPSKRRRRGIGAPSVATIIKGAEAHNRAFCPRAFECVSVRGGRPPLFPRTRARHSSFPV